MSGFSEHAGEASAGHAAVPARSFLCPHPGAPCSWHSLPVPCCWPGTRGAARPAAWLVHQLGCRPAAAAVNTNQYVPPPRSRRRGYFQGKRDAERYLEEKLPGGENRTWAAGSTIEPPAAAAAPPLLVSCIARVMLPQKKKSKALRRASQPSWCRAINRPSPLLGWLLALPQAGWRCGRVSFMARGRWAAPTCTWAGWARP